MTDGLGFVYRGTEFVEAVAESDGAAAYFVTATADGVVETRLDTPKALAYVNHTSHTRTSDGQHVCLKMRYHRRYRFSTDTHASVARDA